MSEPVVNTITYGNKFQVVKDSLPLFLNETNIVMQEDCTKTTKLLLYNFVGNLSSPLEIKEFTFIYY